MGKAARRKRLADRAVEMEQPTRSAYVAALRECVWSSKNPSDDQTRQINELSRILLTHPELRIVKFPVAQADAFRNYGNDLIGAAHGSRPPFRHTFYDFGFIQLANYELAGASIFGEGSQWTCLAYLRQAGRNDWTTMISTSDSVRTTGGRSEVLNPRPDRPESQDDAHAMRLIIAGAFVFLESANVDLVNAVALPRAHQAYGIPHYEVVVRQAKKRHVYPDDHQPLHTDWSHRWEVRGHFKHFRRGVVFEKNADRRISTHDGDEYVRIWCPPHVKGPDDKPLIPKMRTVSAC